jgi:hypothetical protein
MDILFTKFVAECSRILVKVKFLPYNYYIVWFNIRLLVLGVFTKKSIAVSWYIFANPVKNVRC